MDDLIRRQDALDAVDVGNIRHFIVDALQNIISEIPSAQPERCEDCRNFNKTRLLIPQPERKEGKWIYLNELDAFECSVCGRQMVRNIFDYCPWCGARMNGGDDGGET